MNQVLGYKTFQIGLSDFLYENGRLRAVGPLSPYADVVQNLGLARPAFQQKRPFAFFSSGWAQQMVAVAALAIFILGGFSVYQSQQNPIYNSTPTLTAATATFTNEPTATNDDGELTVTSTAVAIQPKQQNDITPSPVATPIAALAPSTSN